MRSLLTVSLLLAGLAAGGPALAAVEDPVPAFDRAAHPVRTAEPGGALGDLRPFGRAVGSASVVSVGEATHSSREFVTMQHRLFRYLATHKGFDTFAREMSWSTGVRLNDYVLRGIGDPGAIMSAEFDAFYQVFDNREFLDLLHWMRAYNRTHAHKLRFMGNDLSFPGPVLFEKVTGYVAARHPELREAVEHLYAGMAPAPGMSLNEYMAIQTGKSLPEREALAARAKAVVNLLRAAGPGDARGEFDWAVQHANALAQSFREYAFDTSTARGRTEAGRYRDQVMAENTEWWYRHRPGRIMVSNMVAHASYVPIDPELAPEPASARLRERLGPAFRTVGFSFYDGSFNAKGPDEKYRSFTLGAPRAEQNEYTLDKVAGKDYFLDLRTLPAEAAGWLRTARPTRNIGGGFDPGAPHAGELQVPLGRSYDMLFHFHHVHAAELRFG
ncbi:erythromycin esterase family protein [Sciscionella sediminilitoris]|uniref:erythromycin esterase family protein n=1 Tax=Sciscionella sediminilitoris TaxID=1445613 RepID=UPI00068F5F0B|nr:erythromycin esterase family protein [Sciscionella sp. SE31]